MFEWVEERCEAIRLALRIPSLPVERDLYRLADWLGGCVILEHAEIEQGRCVHRPDRRAVITLPVRAMGRRMDESLCHELGHALLTMGVGSLLRQSDDPRLQRLAKLWTVQDEALAREFVMAWFLPSAVVAAYPHDDDLAELTHCTLEMVHARRASLGGRVVRLIRAPAWSASREYHVVTQHSTLLPLVYVARLGSVEPVFAIPAGSHEAADESTTQVAADLIAMTTTEFELKYEPGRCTRPTVVEADLERLRRWAGA